MAVMSWLKERQINKIALWGRSMGAATAQNFTYNSDNAVKCLILDSPFTNVAEMVRDTLSSLRGMPGIVTSTALQPIRNTIKKKTGYDVVNLDIINLVKEVRVPAQFIVANDDKITPHEKVQSMYKIYKGNPKRFLIVEGEHHTERDKIDLNFSINFVEGNIGFRLEDRESYVPPQPKAAKDRFKKTNAANTNHLNGVSRGQGLEKIPGYKRNCSDSDSEEEGFWGKVGKGFKKGWNNTVEGTSKGWGWTKEKWNDISDSFVNDVSPKLFGGCGCVDNVDTKNQDDMSMPNRDSIDSSTSDVQRSLPPSTMTESIYPDQLRSPDLNRRSQKVIESAQKNAQNRDNRISHIKSRENLQLDQSFMDKEDESNKTSIISVHNRPPSNYQVRSSSRNSYKKGEEVVSSEKYLTTVSYENGKKVIRKVSTENSARGSYRDQNGNPIERSAQKNPIEPVSNYNNATALPPRPVTRTVRYDANGHIVSKNY